VGAIEDTLKLEKNIGLCRNFQLLDRTEVFRYGLLLEPLRTRIRISASAGTSSC
jgi:hypothetical protein